MKELKAKRVIISGIAAVVILITALSTNSYINKVRNREEFKKAIESNKTVDKETKIEEKDTVNKPLTPDTILANGLTATEGRSLLQFQIDLCNYQELPEEEKMNLLEQLCKDMGTTYEELIKIELAEAKPQQQIKEPVAEQPATTPEEPEATYQAPVQSNGSGVTEWDKNGNGIADSIEDCYVGDGVGSTEESPDVIFEMPGEESTEWDKNGNCISDSFEDGWLTGEGSTEESPDVTFEMP